LDNFKAIYKILSELEKAMDLPQFDLSMVNHEVLGITKERWTRYIEMMVDVNYIKGVTVSRDVCGEIHIKTNNIRITLKGLEYLQENSIMRKLYSTAKGIVEIIP